MRTTAAEMSARGAGFTSAQRPGPDWESDSDKTVPFKASHLSTDLHAARYRREGLSHLKLFLTSAPNLLS